MNKARRKVDRVKDDREEQGSGVEGVTFDDFDGDWDYLPRENRSALVGLAGELAQRWAGELEQQATAEGERVTEVYLAANLSPASSRPVESWGFSEGESFRHVSVEVTLVV